MSKHVVQDIISTEDVGRIAANILANPNDYLNKTLTLAADRQSQEQMAQIFSKVMGRDIKFNKLPGLITRLVMGKNLHTMFKYVDEHGGIFVKDLDAMKKAYSGMLSFEQWVEKKFKK